MTLEISKSTDEIAPRALAVRSEERILEIKLGEAHRANHRLLTERDAAVTRAEQAEELLSWTRRELAAARGGWRHEIRCDTSACVGRIVITVDTPPDEISAVDLGRALVQTGIAIGWGIGTDTARELRTQPTGGEDKCPACMRALVAASRARAAATAR